MTLKQSLFIAVITVVVAAVISYYINKNQTETIVQRFKEHIK